MERGEVNRDHGYSAHDGPTRDRIAQQESDAGSYRHQCDKDQQSGAPVCQDCGALNEEGDTQCNPQHEQSSAWPPVRKRGERSLHPSPSRAPRPKAHLHPRLNAFVQIRIALMGYFRIAHSSDFEVKRCATDAAREDAAQRMRSLQGRSAPSRCLRWGDSANEASL